MGALTDLYTAGAFKKRGGSKPSGDNNAASMPGSTGDPDPSEPTKQRSAGRDDSGEPGVIGNVARMTKRAFSKRR
jgi:hypothetical protein